MKYKDFYSDLLLEYTEDILPQVFQALKESDDPLTGVHFSRGIVTGKDDFKNLVREPHLGMNKEPAHRDPIGIYVFPKKYVFSGGLKRNTGFYSAKYYYIIKPVRSKCKILNLSTMTENDLVSILKSMNIPDSYLTDKEVYHHGGSKAGHKLWGILEKFRTDTNQNYNSYSWNKLFKKSGYNVILDEGDSVIHSNEPHQMIYLEPATYEVVDQGSKSREPKIFTDIIKAFPEYTPKKTKKSWSDSDTGSLSLFDKNNPTFQISLSYYGIPPTINLVIHGRKSKDSENKEFSMTFDEYNHNLSSSHIIAEIKKVLSETAAVPNQYLSSEEHTSKEIFTKTLAEYYGLKFNPKHSQLIKKVYFDKSSNMRVSMNITVGTDIHFSVERRQPYSISNFYYSSGVDFDDFKDEPVPNLMKELLIGIRARIDKDQYTKDYNKEDAKKFLNLLEKRVFINRSNR